MSRSSLSLLALVFVLAQIDAIPFADKDVARRVAIEELTLKTTEACKRQNGLCLTNCPQGKRASHDEKESLCGPSLQCCHSLPSDGLYDCEERTGVCRPGAECKSAPVDEVGRCGEGHVCCVLVY